VGFKEQLDGIDVSNCLWSDLLWINEYISDSIWYIWPHTDVGWHIFRRQWLSQRPRQEFGMAYGTVEHCWQINPNKEGGGRWKRGKSPVWHIYMGWLSLKLSHDDYIIYLKVVLICRIYQTTSVVFIVPYKVKLAQCFLIQTLYKFPLVPHQAPAILKNFVWILYDAFWWLTKTKEAWHDNCFLVWKFWNVSTLPRHGPDTPENFFWV
jgi:hypothetical protein